MGGYSYELYEDKNGCCPIMDFFQELKDADTKESRSLLKSINHLLTRLEICGTSDGMPGFRNIGGNHRLREMRIRHAKGYYRFFIGVCPWERSKFVLLHYIRKDTGKTPPSDIKRAERIMDDYIARRGE